MARLKTQGAGDHGRATRSSHPGRSRHALRSETFVPYLINHAGGRWIRAMAQILRGSPIGYTGWRVLATLSDFKTMHLTDLAEYASFDLSTLSRVVASLETQGLIERDEDARRGRAVPIGLTEAGWDFMEKYLPLALETEGDLLSALTERERLTLIKLLLKLHRNRPLPETLD
jgi:DNA-binding MarR family transcriptional regulator